jgi:hypothetical protein
MNVMKEEFLGQCLERGCFGGVGQPGQAPFKAVDGRGLCGPANR